MPDICWSGEQLGAYKAPRNTALRNSSGSLLPFWWGRSGYLQILNSNYFYSFHHSGTLQLRAIKAQRLWLIQILLPLAFMKPFIIIEAISEDQEKQSIKEIIKTESWGRWICDNRETVLQSFSLKEGLKSRGCPSLSTSIQNRWYVLSLWCMFSMTAPAPVHWKSGFFWHMIREQTKIT